MYICIYCDGDIYVMVMYYIKSRVDIYIYMYIYIYVITAI